MLTEHRHLGTSREKGASDVEDILASETEDQFGLSSSIVRGQVDRAERVTGRPSDG
jgi:hypothetical protein